MNGRLWKKIDWIFFGLIMLLVAIGFMLIFSSSKGLVEDTNLIIIKSIFFLIVGLIIIFIVSSVDYLKYMELEKFLYIVMIVMLLSVLIFGQDINGAKSWFSLGIFSIQPAEFSKIFLILCLGGFFNRNFNNLNTFTQIFKSFRYILLPFILIMLQPDLGTAMVYVFIVFGMLFFSSANKKKVCIVLLSGLGLILGWLALHLIFGVPIPLAEYQIQRFIVFLDPYNDGKNGLGAGYNITQALIASGSGGFFGKGFGNATQINFLPEHHTDFIFSVIGEEFGFIGVIVLLVIYFFFLLKVLSIAYECLNNYGFIIIIGFVSMFLFHIVENIGMNISLMPVTGIPLPFISYGGSNLWTNLIACGIIFSISIRRTKEIF